MMGIQGLYKPKKSWVGCHHLLLVYNASKLSTVYLVKSPVQRAPKNSEFAPSVWFSLDYPRFTYVSHGSQNAPARIVPKQPKPGTICHPKPVGTNPGLTQ